MNSSLPASRLFAAPHALADGTDLAAFLREQRVDLVGFAEIARAQHDAARLIRAFGSAHGARNACRQQRVRASRPRRRSATEYSTRRSGANSASTWRHAPHGDVTAPAGPATAIAVKERPPAATAAKDGVAFRADRQTVRRVLDVAPRDDRSVRAQECRADREMRIRCVGVFARGLGRRRELVHGHVRRVRRRSRLRAPVPRRPASPVRAPFVKMRTERMRRPRVRSMRNERARPHRSLRLRAASARTGRPSAADRLEILVRQVQAERALTSSMFVRRRRSLRRATMRIGSSSPSSCSSRISPTISSSRSSIVTRPAVPPYSSTTIASENLPRCISRSSSETRLVSGTSVIGRISERSVDCARCRSRARSATRDRARRRSTLSIVSS
jgi:hypothetical protein